MQLTRCCFIFLIQGSIYLLVSDRWIGKGWRGREKAGTCPCGCLKAEPRGGRRKASPEISMIKQFCFF